MSPVPLLLFWLCLRWTTAVHFQPLTHPFEPLNFDRTALDRLQAQLKQPPTRWRRQILNEDVKSERSDIHKWEGKKTHWIHRSFMIGSVDPQFFSRWSPTSNKKLFTSSSLPFEDDDEEFRKKTLHKRSLPSTHSHFEITFYSHQRPFKLRLHVPNVSQVFAPDAEFESTSRGRFHYPTNHVLRGHIQDEEEHSEVEGVLTHDGLLDGFIRSGDDHFYIEPAHRYFANASDEFHSVIYRLSDVPFPSVSCKDHQHQKSSISKKTNSTFNVSFGFHSQSFENVVLSSNTSQSRVRRSTNTSSHENSSPYSSRYRHSSPSSSSKSNNANTRPKDYYWKEMDALHYNSEAYGVRAVQRTHWPGDTEQSHLVVDSRKSTCMLYLQADHLFYNRMGSEEACIETMIRHVQKVNSIYRVTDFDQDGRSDNISFLIKRIKVHTSDALKDTEYRFPSNYGVERFLELFSEEDYDAFCLAYMFTYRDFEGGTLGLAWTGDLKNAGGVCEKNGHYRGSLKSLNTGIVTLLNYGKHVPPIVSHVTLAHEIGHNFGSPHDPEDDGSCTPGGENGNYIMFARATSGDKRNNNRFSPCSLKSVNAVLNTKARSLKGCFQEPQESICGNEVVEEGEDCDCGWEEDCTEPCCFPMRSNPPAHETPCKLRPGFICSPSQGPCCTQECRLKVGNKCRDDNGCRTAAYCNGQGPQCPPSTNKPNKTICNDEFVCYMGECTGSICIAYGLESCQCKRTDGDPDTKLCELCCRMPGDDSTCKSSFEWNSSPYDVPDLYAKPGTPCDNYHGYCDVTQHCREVHPSGPLATLRRFLLSDQSMAWLRSWLQHQWLCAAALCSLALLLCLLLLRALRRAAHAQQQQAKSSSIGQLGVAAAAAAAFTTSLPNSTATSLQPPVSGAPAITNTNNSGFLFPNRNNSYTAVGPQPTSAGISGSAAGINSQTTGSISQTSSLGSTLKTNGTSHDNSSYNQVSNHYGYIGEGAYGNTYNAYEPYAPANDLYGYTGYGVTGGSSVATSSTATSSSNYHQLQPTGNNANIAYGYTNGPSNYYQQQQQTQSSGSTGSASLQAHRQSNNSGLYGITGTLANNTSGLINGGTTTTSSCGVSNNSSIYGYTGQYGPSAQLTSNSNNTKRSMQMAGVGFTSANAHSAAPPVSINRTTHGSTNSGSSNCAASSGMSAVQRNSSMLHSSANSYGGIKNAPLNYSASNGAKLHGSSSGYMYSSSSNASASSDQPMLGPSGSMTVDNVGCEYTVNGINGSNQSQSSDNGGWV